LAFSSAKGATDASELFLASLRSGECSEIYADQLSQEFLDSTSEANWIAVCEQIGPILQGDPNQKGIRVESNAGEPSQAGIGYDIAGSDGKTYEIGLSLIKEDGIWKIVSLDSKSI
jgi:hypothetical protein